MRERGKRAKRANKVQGAAREHWALYQVSPHPLSLSPALQKSACIRGGWGGGRGEREEGRGGEGGGRGRGERKGGEREGREERGKCRESVLRECAPSPSACERKREREHPGSWKGKERFAGGGENGAE
jgi:hypothetical protein